MLVVDVADIQWLLDTALPAGAEPIEALMGVTLIRHADERAELTSWMG